MSVSQQSGLQVRVPSARSVLPATGRAGARYDTDFNSVGGYYSGPHNSHLAALLASPHRSSHGAASESRKLNQCKCAESSSARNQTIVDAARNSGA